MYLDPYGSLLLLLSRMLLLLLADEPKDPDLEIEPHTGHYLSSSSSPPEWQCGCVGWRWQQQQWQSSSSSVWHVFRGRVVVPVGV